MKKLLFLSIALIVSVVVFFYFYKGKEAKLGGPFNLAEQRESPVHIDGKHLGYDLTKEKPHLIPKHVSPHLSHLPREVDYSDCMPPVGNQEGLSTCVAWAVAYYGLTGMHCLHSRMNLSSYGVKDSKNQGSPSDLFMAIPSHLKSQDCKGTAFEPALNTLLHRGNAPLALEAYDSLGTCDDQPSMGWNAIAYFSRMKNYRRVDLDLNTLKETLADKYLILFSAKITKGLVAYDGGIFGRNSKRNESNSTSETGEHAMLLVGYSESKKAFKFINSWGKDWGEDGYAWVDYTFFVENFAHGGLFTMDFPTNMEQISELVLDPITELGRGLARKSKDRLLKELEKVGDEYGLKEKLKDVLGVFGDKTSANCLHLTPWVFLDSPTRSKNGLQREVRYNIYNDHGLVKSKDGFKVLFLYVNAYDFEDFGLLYRKNLLKKGEELKVNENLDQYRKEANSKGRLVFNNGTSKLSFKYELPLTTGKYYLAMLVEDEIISDKSACHFFFASEQSPVEVVNGRAVENGKDYYYKNAGDYINLAESSSKGKFSTRDTIHPKEYTPHESTNRNAYTPAEIMQGLENAMQSKKWRLMVKEFNKRNKDTCIYRVAYKKSKIQLNALSVPTGQYTWYKSNNQIDYTKIKNANKYQYSFNVKKKMTYFRCDVKIPISMASQYSNWGWVKEKDDEFVTRSVCFVVEGLPPTGTGVGKSRTSEEEDSGDTSLEPSMTN